MKTIAKVFFKYMIIKNFKAILNEMYEETSKPGRDYIDEYAAEAIKELKKDLNKISIWS